MTRIHPLPPLLAALIVAAAVAGCQSSSGGGNSAAGPVDTWNSYSASRSNRGGD